MFHTKRSLAVSILALLSVARACLAQDTRGLVAGQAAGEPAARIISRANHPAVGSWFGRAVQLCADPNNATTCPKLTILMTPSMTPDGVFTGVDSTAIGGPPFGPHTAAHGQWYPINNTTAIADYVFMSNPVPAPAAPAMSVSRFRWESQAIDSQTMIGYINFYPYPAVPVAWESITDSTKFPALPAEATGPLTAPLGMVTDPTTCQTAACPLVFKFTVKRVSPLGIGFGR